MHKCTDKKIFIERDELSYFDHLQGWKFQKVNFCPICGECLQPERSKREDVVEYIYKDLETGQMIPTRSSDSKNNDAVL